MAGMEPSGSATVLDRLIEDLRAREVATDGQEGGGGEDGGLVVGNMRVAASKTIGRRDMPQYDLAAVFEALVNAVAHRDYSMYGSKIRPRMFANRLEIYSPGALTNTMTVDSLAFRRASRNETIASLLAKCPVPADIDGVETPRSTLMDRRGEGVSIILERSERLSGKRPVYELPDESELKLTIFAAAIYAEDYPEAT